MRRGVFQSLEKMHALFQGAAGGAESGGGQAKDDDVVDADFEEVKDDKK